MSETHGNRFVLQRVQQRGIGHVELWWQVAGAPRRTLHVPADELEAVLDDGIAVHGSASGDLPAVLVPDPATFLALHVGSQAGDASTSGRLICDLQRPDGAPHGLCTRSLLKRSLGRVGQRGARYYLGARIDHRWVGTDGAPLEDATVAATLAHRLGRRMEKDGHALRSWSSRSSDAHWSFEYNWVDPLTLADTLATHRAFARNVAREIGLDASFVRRLSRVSEPVALEVFISRDDAGAETWADPLHPAGLSAEGRALQRRVELAAADLALALRTGVHGWKAPEAFMLTALDDARGGDGAAVRLSGADAGADPYLAAALALALAARDDDPGASSLPGHARAPERVLGPVPLLDEACGGVIVAALQNGARRQLEAWWDELGPAELAAVRDY